MLLSHLLFRLAQAEAGCQLSKRERCSAKQQLPAKGITTTAEESKSPGKHRQPRTMTSGTRKPSDTARLCYCPWEMTLLLWEGGPLLQTRPCHRQNAPFFQPLDSAMKYQKCSARSPGTSGLQGSPRSSLVEQGRREILEGWPAPLLK